MRADEGKPVVSRSRKIKVPSQASPKELIGKTLITHQNGTERQNSPSVAS